MYTVDYRRQSVELREAGVTKEELANDQRKLEDRLRKKDEESRVQEEELMKLRGMYVYICICNVYMYYVTLCVGSIKPCAVVYNSCLIRSVCP